jgi:branched-chain amino acid transport system substrate-binding protein
MRQRHWRVRVLVIGVALATIASTAITASASVPRKASGPPLIIGWVGDTSGPQGVAGQQTRAGLEAWVADVNAGDGLNGHRVKLIARDVGTDSSKALATVRDLVENEGVIAFVGNASSDTDASFLPYLKERNIPIIGAQGYSQALSNQPISFPAATSLIPDVYMQLFAAADAGAKKFGLFWCSSNTACAGAVPLYDNFANQNNIELVFDQKLDDTASEFTADCLAAQNADVDALGIAAASNVGQRVIRSCVRQHYNPVYVVPASGYTDDLLALAEDGTLKHLVVPSDTFLWFVKKGAAQREFHTAVRKYAPDVPLGPPIALGWMAGKLLEAAGANLPDNATTQDVLDGLYALKDETLGGLAPQPLTFTKGAGTEVKCWFMAEVKGGKLRALNGGKPQCQPAP